MPVYAVVQNVDGQVKVSDVVSESVSEETYCGVLMHSLCERQSKELGSLLQSHSELLNTIAHFAFQLGHAQERISKEVADYSGVDTEWSVPKATKITKMN